MAPEEFRARLVAVAEALKPLHKELITAVKVEYERAHGPVGGTIALFNLVTQHPFFAWLREMSAYMAELDERLEDVRPVEVEELRRHRGRLEGMLEPEGSFGARYFPLMQAAPEVAIFHVAFKQAIARL